MHKLPEWITAIAAVVTAGGIWFLRKQLELMKLQIDNDHERSRRENSINYLFEWSKGLLRSSSLARRLVEELNEEQTKALAKEEELRIDTKHKDLILGVLSTGASSVLVEKGHEIILDKSQVADIRWQVVRYLNILESVFEAAHQGVADKKILVEELSYLYDKTKGHYVLKKFREVMGGADGYPALEELEEELRKKHAPGPPATPLGSSTSP